MKWQFSGLQQVNVFRSTILSTNIMVKSRNLLALGCIFAICIAAAAARQSNSVIADSIEDLVDSDDLNVSTHFKLLDQ